MENADTHAGELSPSFVCALTDAQFDLLAFICMLLGNRDMAQDVLQDTNLRLISHSAEYDTRRPFLPWAKAFAYNQVRTFVKKSARSRLVFDEGLVDALAASRSRNKFTRIGLLGMSPDFLERPTASTP